MPVGGRNGYITPAVLGVPNSAERGVKSVVAHWWADWLHNPCRLGVPTSSERGGQCVVAHGWAEWLHNPCRLGDPQLFRAGMKMCGHPLVGGGAT